MADSQNPFDYLVVVRRAKKDLNGKFFGRYWFDGETGPFFNENEAREVVTSHGGSIVPFKESRLAVFMRDYILEFAQDIDAAVAERENELPEAEIEDIEEEISVAPPEEVEPEEVPEEDEEEIEDIEDEEED